MAPDAALHRRHRLPTPGDLVVVVERATASESAPAVQPPITDLSCLLQQRMSPMAVLPALPSRSCARQPARSNVPVNQQRHQPVLLVSNLPLRAASCSPRANCETILHTSSRRIPQQRRGLPRLTVAAIALLAVLTLVVGAYIIGRNGPSVLGPPAVGEPATEPLSWAMVDEFPVPSSPLHGPRQTEDGLASGFSQDELGAVIAAINIMGRLSSSDPRVYETTARRQCVGDAEATIALIRGSFSTSPTGAATPTEIFYMMIPGGVSTSTADIMIAARTPQANAYEAYVAVSVSLRWIDGDWKVQLPQTPPRIVSSVAGYTSLGPIPPYPG